MITVGHNLNRELLDQFAPGDRHTGERDEKEQKDEGGTGRAIKKPR